MKIEEQNDPAAGASDNGALMSRCVLIGTNVAGNFGWGILNGYFGDDATIIGDGRSSPMPMHLALKAVYGVSPVEAGDVSGRILLQFGEHLFDMEELLDAAKSRREALLSGSDPADLWRGGRAAVQQLKAHYGVRDN